ncbi:hypothetical protein SAMN04488542_102191 [Fontibacillus panacisegetis]|uniref:Uncharacterized protein n=1 Tax=Fontibacillus panacisegetis TaxID=670482 RepID=A0A1G7FXE8_9BACL|nr:hypothetical protein SAMN04488542_102191 [Fontibacillus panacisegetis]
MNNKGNTVSVSVIDQLDSRDKKTLETEGEKLCLKRFI